MTWTKFYLFTGYYLPKLSPDSSDMKLRHSCIKLGVWGGRGGGGDGERERVCVCVCGDIIVVL